MRILSPTTDPFLLNDVTSCIKMCDGTIGAGELSYISSVKGCQRTKFGKNIKLAQSLLLKVGHTSVPVGVKLSVPFL